MSRWTDTGSDFEQAPTGTFAARCIRVIELGTQTSQYGTKRKTILTWELPTELMDNGKPFIISRFYTASLNEKAILRQDLEAWRGKTFTEQELAGFDQRQILGKPCLITTIEEEGKTKVKSVSALLKGVEVPPQVNESLFYDVDAHDESAFAKLSSKIQDMIKSSKEWQERHAPKAQVVASGSQASHQAAGFGDNDGDEIPFKSLAVASLA